MGTAVSIFGIPGIATPTKRTLPVCVNVTLINGIAELKLVLARVTLTVKKLSKCQQSLSSEFF